MAKPVHLFLDFDGVLHPKGAGQSHFTCLPKFETCMRESALAEVAIVISSTWRIAYNLDKLRSFFSPDIAARVVGTTSTLREYRTAYERGEEIEAYVAKHHVGPWLALDDDSDGFSKALRTRLILCDGMEGFNDAIAAKLREHVTA